MRIQKILVVPISIVILTCYAISPALSATKDSTSAEIQKETTDLLKALKNYSVEQRDIAVRETKAAIDQLDKRLEDLETDTLKTWDQINNATRDEKRKILKNLRKQRSELAEWYGSLKAGSADGWDEIKDGFSKAYQALSNSWEKAQQGFSSNN